MAVFVRVVPGHAVVGVAAVRASGNRQCRVYGMTGVLQAHYSPAFSRPDAFNVKVNYARNIHATRATF